jgi:hypothetical protein
LSTARPAPGLLLKTLAVTFLTVIVLLVVVFTFVTMRAQQQVRESVTANLESTERLFAALETQRQGEMRAMPGPSPKIPRSRLRSIPMARRLAPARPKSAHSGWPPWSTS